MKRQWSKSKRRSSLRCTRSRSFLLVTRSSLVRPTRSRLRDRRHSSLGWSRLATRIHSSILSIGCTRLWCKCQTCSSMKTRSSAAMWATSKRCSCTHQGLFFSLTWRMGRKSSKAIPSSILKKYKRLLIWQTCACDSLQSVKRSTERFQAYLSSALPKVASMLSRHTMPKRTLSRTSFLSMVWRIRWFRLTALRGESLTSFSYQWCARNPAILSRNTTGSMSQSRELDTVSWSLETRKICPGMLSGTACFTSTEKTSWMESSELSSGWTAKRFTSWETFSEND